jgi:tRNA 2-thiouridine synthesizing protein A
MTTQTAKADVTLDLRGVPCPLPPLKTLKALAQMETGQVLEVVGANPIGKRSAPWIAKALGNQLLGSDRDESGVERFYLKKA